MDTDKKKKIPNDISIEEFHKYLSENKRAILSARFGDGKSTFLKDFYEKKEIESKYTFITVYPVNYQVADNRDIFEYIKRDILIQLLSMVELDNKKIKTSLMLWSYLNNNKLDIVDDLYKI